MTFPTGFLWGAGTAAHQVEGGNTGTDWAVWERGLDSPCAEPSGDACDHWNRVADDLDLLAGLGLNSYRFSIEWARIEPSEGEFSVEALEHYRQVCELARSRNLEPLVVFHHFTTPLWVVNKGGWSAPDTVERFALYCETTARHLAGTFKHACTINEPNILAAFGYEIGIFPPGERNSRLKEEATEVLIAAHTEAAARIRRAAPGTKVGMAISMHEYATEPGCEQRMDRLRSSAEDVFLEAARSDDFVGVQNYTRLHVGPSGIIGPPDGSRTNQIGLEFRPEALGVTVRRAAELAGLPVLVTENGICTEDDSERIEYVELALRSLEGCLSDGIDLLGYLHWSALDSYEWVLGYWPKYGLIEVDRATQTRTPRKSGVWLGRVARANRLVGKPS